MDVGELMDEVATALGAIDGLRPYPYWVQSASPPAAIVGWPETVTFDQTYGRGSDRLTIPVFVIVGKADERASKAALSAYLTGSGATSVKAAIDGGTYSTADSVTVTQARIDVVTMAAVDYLAGVFDVDCYGTGSA